MPITSSNQDKSELSQYDISFFPPDSVQPPFIPISNEEAEINYVTEVVHVIKRN